MSAALWGFTGTILGGFITLLATWWQQRHSAAREERAFRRAEEERRRAFEVRTLKELQELVIVASCDLYAVRYALKVKQLEEAVARLTAWGASDVRMQGLLWSLDDNNLQAAVLDAFVKMHAVIGAIGKQEDEARVREALNASFKAYLAVQTAIGPRLRKLA